MASRHIAAQHLAGGSPFDFAQDSAGMWCNFPTNLYDGVDDLVDDGASPGVSLRGRYTASILHLFDLRFIRELDQ